MNKEQETILNKYIEYLKLRQREYKTYKSSVKQYLKYLNQFGLHYLNVRIINASDYQEYLTMLLDETGKNKYSSVTVGHKIKSLISFYDYLKKQNMVLYNSFREIKKARVAKKLPDNILNEEEFNLLLKSLSNFNNETAMKHKRKKYRAHLIAELMYSTGARINEIANIKLSDIDFARSIVKITDSKNSKERIAFLNSYTEKILRIYIDETRKYFSVFCKEWKKEYLFGASLQTITILINQVLKKETRRLKINKISSHGIRHAVGLHLLRAGCDIRYIQELLGHKDIKNTQIYTKIDTRDLKGVIDKYHPRRLRSIKDEVA